MKISRYDIYDGDVWVASIYATRFSTAPAMRLLMFYREEIVVRPEGPGEIVEFTMVGSYSDAFNIFKTDNGVKQQINFATVKDGAGGPRQRLSHSEIFFCMLAGAAIAWMIAYWLKYFAV